MRSFGTAALLLALTTTPVLAGCSSGADDASDVPTITTRPSATHKPTKTPKPTVTPSSEPPTSATAPESTVSAVPPTAPVTTETGPSPAPPTDEPGGPTTYDDAETRIEQVGTDAGGTTTDARFATPHDVVYCLLDDPVIGPSCELSTGFIKDDDVCGGDIADGVGRIETYKGRARPVCNSDTIREPGAPTVGAPAVVVSGDVECAVEAAGVTCLDVGAHTGFYIGPREYHVF